MSSLIPFKSKTSGRATLEGYAGPRRILVKGYIPFRVSRSPLKTIMGNEKRKSYEYNLPTVLWGRPKPRFPDVVGYLKQKLQCSPNISSGAQRVEFISVQKIFIGFVGGIADP
jgi:hypothetical protein